MTPPAAAVLDDSATPEEECGGGRRIETSYVGMSERISREGDRGTAQVGSRARSFDSSASLEPLGFQTYRPNTTGAPELGEGERDYRSFVTGPTGSVEGLEDERGEVQESAGYHYDPYGAQMRRSGDMAPAQGSDELPEAELSPLAQENPLRFQGHYYDSGIRSYDTPSRPYMPEIGRFSVQDRFESARADFSLTTDPLTQNRYAFAGGNPVNMVDWDGHEPASSFTDGCDASYGSDRRCREQTRQGGPRQRRRARERYARARRYQSDPRYNYAYSSNWRAGRRTTPAQDHLNAAGAAHTAQPKWRLEAERKAREDDGGGGIPNPIEVGKGFVEGGVETLDQLRRLTPVTNPTGFTEEWKKTYEGLKYAANNPGEFVDALEERYKGDRGLGRAFFDAAAALGTRGVGGALRGGATGAKAGAAAGNDGIGPMRRLEYEPSPKHGRVQRGRASRAPEHPEQALDQSLQVNPRSPRRIGIDYTAGEFVVFDQTRPGIFHGHVRSWRELRPQMQKILRDAGMVDRRGNILRGRR